MRASLLLLLPFGCHKAGSTSASQGLAPTADCFAALSSALADDGMEGRGVGTAGLENAATYLESQLKKAGLSPVDGSYRQSLQVTTGVALADGNALSGPAGALALGGDFSPLGFSGSGAFTGELAFIGYGIRAPDLGYDDYAGVDLKGKVALAFRYEPGERDEASPFDGKRPTRYSDLRHKALLAREAGAVALVLVAPPAMDDEPDKLPALRVDGPQSDAGLPVIQVTRAVAEAWMKAGGQDLWALRAAIDASYKPSSAAVAGVSVTGKAALAPTTASVENVVGFLPGAGALADEVVVVGAHYDHLGYGGVNSRAPDRHEIHNGADDNASGVAAMVCGVAGLRDGLAGSTADRRGLLVLAFTAEEIGLGGSAWYVGHPLLPLEKTAAMINLDMVGRVRDGRLSALGTDSATGWSAILAPAAQAAGLTLAEGGDGYGPSDQMSFYTHGVPVVHLFSGSHEQYHTPEDDAALLNNAGGGQVALLLQEALGGLLSAPERLSFEPPQAGPVMAGDSRGYGSYFGSIPDYTAMEGTGQDGVKLSGVRPGSPADEAGVLAGDVLIGMGGVSVRNLYDMTFVLQDHKPGDIVEILVRRGDAEVKLAATLRARPAGGSSHGGGGAWVPTAGKDASALLDGRERHLADLRQLTFGGENAEAYWSPDGRKLIFQRTDPGGCDKEYLMDLSSGEVTQLSSGDGRTTCGYFAWPKGERTMYATTEAAGAACPAPPDMSQGYVWAIYPSYDIVWQDGPGKPTTPFLPNPGYDAEATACMVDGRVIFTSTRGGDLDLWSAKPDGSDLKQLTNTPGYDGGAYFSSDCKSMVWRASRPEGKALDDYKRLLKLDLVRPSSLEIYWANADGSNPRKLTNNGAANFGPYPLPGDKGAIFASNMGSDPREFDLWMVGLDGGEPERVTYTAEFDGFPMFSPDNQWLVFASNRGGVNHETNLFVARWVP